VARRRTTCVCGTWASLHSATSADLSINAKIRRAPGTDRAATAAAAYPRPDTDNPLLCDSCWQSRNVTNTKLTCADCNREYTLGGCDTPHYGSRNSCGECRPDRAHRCQRCKFPLVLERPRALLWQSLVDIGAVEDSPVPTLCGMCENFVTSADMSGYKPA